MERISTPAVSNHRGMELCLRLFCVCGALLGDERTLAGLAHLIWILVTQLELNAYIVQLSISVALTVVSYWAHKYYSFKRPNHDEENLGLLSALSSQSHFS